MANRINVFSIEVSEAAILLKFLINRLYKLTKSRKT